MLNRDAAQVLFLQSGTSRAILTVTPQQSREENSMWPFLNPLSICCDSEQFFGPRKVHLIRSAFRGGQCN